MAKKIAIVGTADSAGMANNLGDDWKIWSCNAAHKKLNRFDLQFELHPIEYLHDIGIEPAYFEHLKNCGNKLVLQKKNVDYPEAQEYPLQEIIDSLKAAYFNNTIAYMIAYAIYMNPDLEELGIFGVDMAAETEYKSQRPCCEFWLGVAYGRKIIITIPDTSPLVKATHLYGFEELPPHLLGIKKRADKLKAGLKQRELEKERAAFDWWYHKGAVEALDKIVGAYV